MLRISCNSPAVRRAVSKYAFFGNLKNPIILEVTKRWYSSTGSAGSIGTARAVKAVESHTTWSTPHDNVPTSLFNKSSMHFWSIFDACLVAGQFERAQNLLKGFHGTVSIDEFLKASNLFFQKFEESSKHDLESIRRKFLTLPQEFPDLKLNPLSYAILLKATAQKSEFKNEAIRKFVSDIEDKVAINDVLYNIDILGIACVKDVIKACNLDPSALRTEYQEILNIETEIDAKVIESEFKEQETPETMKLGEELQTESLKKGDIASLESVDTFGMKTLRHTLIGLVAQQNPIVFDKFIQGKKLDKEGADAIFISDKHNDDDYVDFFQISKNLSSEQRAEFDQVLETFNSERQNSIESRALYSARQKWKNDFEKMKAATGKIKVDGINHLLWEWHEQMTPLIVEELKKVQAMSDANVTTKKSMVYDPELETRAQAGDRFDYGPYLTLLTPEKLSVITILELLKLNSSNGASEGVMRTAKAVLAVGKAVEMEYRSDQILKDEKRVFNGVKLTKNSPELRKMMTNAKFTFRENELTKQSASWPTEMKAKIGSVLISMLLHVAKVPVKGIDPETQEEVQGTSPAIYHTYQYLAGSRIGVLKFHKIIAKKLSSENMTGSIQPHHLPMLIKPKPWTSWNNGGYYMSKSYVMRTKESPEQQAYLKEASKRGAMNEVFEGLNVLGNTSWTINKDIFKVVMQLWNTGKPFLDIPGISDDVELPTEPARNVDPAIRRDWLRECRAIVNRNQADHSQRCDTNYKLEIARAFLGERLYFPHNMDFRGRAYPLSPHLNHLGSDLSRGLLMFWNGREVGARGFRWLKIQLANVFGFDKASFNDREKFADNHIKDIYDSAEKPLDGQKWWMTADDPWQALAVCMELSKAYSMDDPTKFVSRLPIHQDGTCNGLQHYAALGGDIEGANQVNLIPSDKPQDIYSEVANIVRARINNDFENGNETAALIKDHISRKVVKQTVMTNVYGVTFIGARAQIAKQIKDLPHIGPENIFIVASYLTINVFAAVRSLFHAAHLIQDWLGECAKMISKAVRIDITNRVAKNGNRPDFMSSVIWTTPLGLPIVQPYRDFLKKQISTNLQTVYITDPYALEPVKSRKQVSAFPPNYIHSLDATHMLMSAIECGKKNLSFAAVHDSYWTHAADVDDMNSILRDAFIRLHEVDLVTKLKTEFDRRYEGFLHFVTIDKNSEPAKRIIEHRKLHSKQLGKSVSVADEIEEERRRRSMLNSSKPSERKLGDSMVTSVSIIEEYDNIEQFYLKKKIQKSVFVPLKFPEVPPKGEFDVHLLRDSPYFFS
ncbi:mitochondrial RNA polymerase [Nadsonia fulvescens var. elongata DSM 6958]|uniref:DNA-directed RNA polymerase n=1 Tax=Nadsonia fulvescens var. elongata DSM 6958 TaxID=857566 RepID=A0A1E3PUP0_9ASCO|nr:mitochondrial RNA polymerase [Nadsonia fulvescens var. elongata DSM 6958]